jgi:hypothetical protein
MPAVECGSKGPVRDPLPALATTGAKLQLCRLRHESSATATVGAGSGARPMRDTPLTGGRFTGHPAMLPFPFVGHLRYTAPTDPRLPVRETA